MSEPLKPGQDWLILSLKRSKDSEHLVWYRPDCNGYTTNLNEAGRYTREQARRIRERKVAMPVRTKRAYRASKVITFVESGQANLDFLLGRKAEEPIQ